MKRNAAVVNSEDEARQLERELMPLLSEERRVAEEISRTRSALSDAKQGTPLVLIDGRLGLDKKRHEAAEAKELKLTTLEASLTRAERLMLKLTPNLTSKLSKLREVRRESENDRVERCTAVVAAAVEKESSLRDELRARESRLSDLRGQFSSIEKELHSVLTDQANLAENADERARVLIETGQFPSSSSVPDNAAKAKELVAQERTLAAAIRMQEKAVHEARRALAHAVAQHLRPAMENVVQRIAQGYSTARSATADADRIRYAFWQATGAEESLPCFVFEAVPVPPIDVKDQFGFWLDDMRAQGYEV